MSANGKRLVALGVSALAAAFIGLAWGVVLRGLGESVLECVKDGAGAGGGTFVVCLAIIVLFPFKDDPGTSLTPQAPAPPRTPTA
ncbi:hypothetical protein [Streptomyces hokutonensis]|uniref:hypothetical protein n=1 Tax=Streptomyces hokutonensis TaxID=1306990 RepID=UPI003806F2E8